MTPCLQPLSVKNKKMLCTFGVVHDQYGWESIGRGIKVYPVGIIFLPCIHLSMLLYYNYCSHWHLAHFKAIYCCFLT